MSSKVIIALGALVIGLLALADTAFHGHFSDSRMEREGQVAAQRYNDPARKEQVSVTVQDGWATIDGVVSTDTDRDAAVRDVRFGTDGLRGLTNNVRVLGPCDTGVFSTLKGLIKTSFPDAEVSYTVDTDCNVTLTGWVPSEELRGAVGRLAGSVGGVRSVTNNIEVGYPTKKLEEEIIKILRVQNIYFDFGKATIREESQASIQKIADLLAQRPDVKVSIEGHTDSVDTEQYNQLLSERRAQAVLQALANLGVSNERLTAVGFGESRPIASNDTPEGRAENRRIEFKVQ